MGGQADKKNYANMEYWREKMIMLIAAVNVCYLVSCSSYVSDYEARGGWFYSDIFWLGLHSMVTKWTFGSICTALESGLTAEMMIDLFGLNLFAQLVSCYSEWCRYWLMMIVPGYGLFKLLSLIYGYCCPKKAEEEPVDEKTQKAVDKKKRQDALKEKRGGGKFSKH